MTQIPSCHSQKTKSADSRGQSDRCICDSALPDAGLSTVQASDQQHIILICMLIGKSLHVRICDSPVPGQLTLQAIDRCFAALMSVTTNASSVVAERVSGGTFADVSYVPSCSAGVSFRDYITGRAVAYDPSSWDYYKAIRRSPLLPGTLMFCDRISCPTTTSLRYATT